MTPPTEPSARATPWTSTLSSADAAALATTGFVPAGFVTAASVWSVGFQWGQGVRGKFGRRPPGFSHLYPCSHVQSSWYGRGYSRYRWGPGAGKGAYAGWSGRFNTPDGHEPGINWEHNKYQEAVTAAFDSAYSSLLDRIQELGAHGAIGLVIDQTPVAGGDQLIEFSLWGTAVRHPSAPAISLPFATNLRAPDIVKLLRTGLAPAGVVMGAAAIEAERGCDTRFAESGMVGDVRQYADAIDQARAMAVGRMEQRAAQVGEAIIGCEIDEHLHPQRHSYGAQLTVVGTAVRSFKPPSRSSAKPMTYLSLSRS